MSARKMFFRNTTSLALIALMLAPIPAFALDEREEALQRARLCSMRGELDAASAIYKGLLDAKPEDDEARSGLARVTAWRGNWSEAEKLYREILTRRVDDSDSRAGLIDVLLWQERWTDAKLAIDTGLELRSESAEILERQARLQHYRGAAASAKEAIDKAERLEPMSASIVELADSVFRGEARLSLSNDLYPDGFDDLRRAEISLLQSVDRLRLGFRTEQSQRFASSSPGNGYNAIYAASASYPFAIGWRGTLELGLGAPGRTVPNFLLRAEGDAPLPGPFSFNLSYSFWSYDGGSAIHIIDPALAFDATDRLHLEVRYWLAIARYPAATGTSDSTAFTHTIGARASYRILSRLDIALGYVRGQAIDRQPVVDQLIQLRSHIATLGLAWRVIRELGIAPAYRFEYRSSASGNVQTIHGLELSMFTRW